MQNPAANSRPVGGWLVLNGLRGSGKSTLAGRLAARRGRLAVDLDAEVRRRFGDRSISEIWRTDGEAAFRAAEAETLAEVLDQPPGVLALGGGTAMVPVAAERLRLAIRDEDAFVVYLRTSAERLAVRLRADRAAGIPAAADRPSLRGGDPAVDAPDAMDVDPAEEVRWAIERRDGAYRNLASLVLDVDAILGPDPAAEPADGPERLAAVIEAAISGGCERG